MDEDSVYWTFNHLSFIVLVNYYFQITIGVISLLISIVLCYVVIKSTPEELVARRANVLTQLVGCVLQSVIYSIIMQPVPLYPHRAIIFTGPFRQMGSYSCAILFVLWVASITFNANSAISSSLSHYLGTMEGMKQSNAFLEWYSKLSFRAKAIIASCSHIFVVLWSGTSLFLSMDFEASEGPLAYLRENYSLVRLSASTSLKILGTSFTVFIFFYCFQLLYLNRGVWVQLNELKSSISPRTWEILHHTSNLFLGIAIQPIISFIIPTAIFIPMNFAVSSINSSALLNITVWSTIVLYTSTPFLFYLLTLISFKIYRHHFFSILRSPFSFIFTRRTRRISVSPQIELPEVNKDVI